MIIACAGWVTLVPLLVRLRRALEQTSLWHVWHATCAAWTVWFLVAISSLATSLQSWANCLWYFAAVIALVPPIAALGARKPINRAWNWFVLLPLVGVLSWPIMPALWRGAVNPAGFDLETPMLVGYLLVMIMGAGNYIGLSNTLSALLWIAGLCLLVFPLCPATAGAAPDAGTARPIAVVCLVVASWLIDVKARSRKVAVSSPTFRMDRAVADFRELFGIVWARRIFERFNEEARRQCLPVRLELHGLTTVTGTPLDPQADPEHLVAAEKSFRWLLQKFVTPAWLDERLSGDESHHRR
jgi:hypothetical protein